MTEFQIRKQLRFVHRQDGVSGLYFDDDFVLDKEIYTVSERNRYAVVENRKWLFGFEGHSQAL